jgi:dTMP kinase
MVARMLPALLFGPIAGVLVDRMDRKKMMIVADLSRAALYATMPFLGKLYLIFFVSFDIECFSLLWSPSRDASLPNLVPRRQLANANSLGLITTYGTLPLGGLIFAFLAGGSDLVPVLSDNPEAVPLLLDGATYLFSAFMVSRINFPPPSARTGERLDMSRVGRDIVDGLRFLRESSLASAMTLGIVVAFTSSRRCSRSGRSSRTTPSGPGTPAGDPRHSFGVGMGIRINIEQGREPSTAARLRLVAPRGGTCSCSQPCRIELASI